MNHLIPGLDRGYWTPPAPPHPTNVTLWYKRGERVVGLYVALLIRDVLSRVTSGLTVALILGLVLSPGISSTPSRDDRSGCFSIWAS